MTSRDVRAEATKLLIEYATSAIAAGGMWSSGPAHDDAVDAIEALVQRQRKVAVEPLEGLILSHSHGWSRNGYYYCKFCEGRAPDGVGSFAEVAHYPSCIVPSLEAKAGQALVTAHRERESSR